VRALFVAISLIFAGIPVAAATPKFEVATVKPSNPNGHDTDLRIYPGGRILITGLPLKTMVAMALDVSWWQIPGGDSWMENDFYDVEPNLRRTSNPRSQTLGIPAGQLKTSGCARCYSRS